MNVIREFDIGSYKMSRGVLLTPALTCLFLLNPVIGLIVTYCMVALSNQDSSLTRHLTKFYCIAIALFLGAVNASKVPENDLVWYFYGYLDAGKFDFLDYIYRFGINGQGRELFFPTINFFLYRLIGPNTDLYIMVVTAFYYGLINLSIYRMCRALQQPPIVAATAALVFGLAPNLFSLSALLLRQNVAFAIVVFIIIEKLFYGKNRYVLMGLAVLTHASSLFFILLCLAPGISKRISIKSFPIFLIVAGLILNYQAMATVASGLFSGDNVISYALMRASIGTNYELPPLRLDQIAFNIALVIALMGTIYVIKPEYKKSQGLVALSNIILVTLIFIVSNLDYSELSVRFNFYYLTLFPAVVAVALSTLRVSLIAHAFIFAQPVLFWIFIRGLYLSMWSYDAKAEILYWPFFLYFSG